MCMHTGTHMCTLDISVLLILFLTHLREIHSNRAVEAKDNCSEKEIFQDSLDCCLPVNNAVISFSSVFRQPTPYSAPGITICYFFFVVESQCLAWCLAHRETYFIIFITPFCPVLTFHPLVPRFSPGPGFSK